MRTQYVLLLTSLFLANYAKANPPPNMALIVQTPRTATTINPATQTTLQQQAQQQTPDSVTNEAEFQKVLAEYEAQRKIAVTPTPAPDPFTEAEKHPTDKKGLEKLCGKPKHWSPDGSYEQASSWQFVPLYTHSNTFGNSSMITLISVGPTKDQQTPVTSSCDYINVTFEGDKIKNVDTSKCKSLVISSGAFADCQKFFGI
ncbi:MAG: hypothetical protein ACXWQQ_15810 [Pseudobdellovibrio sp.]